MKHSDKDYIKNEAFDFNSIETTATETEVADTAETYLKDYINTTTAAISDERLKSPLMFVDEMAEFPDRIWKPINRIAFENFLYALQDFEGVLLKQRKEQAKKGFNLNWIDTSDIYIMASLFEGTNINWDISRWDVSKVTNMQRMFYKSNFNGDISNWDVSNVKQMNYMFGESAFNGDLSKWDTHNVTSMYYMFSDSHFNGDISNWNTSNVQNMSSMFKNSDFNGDLSKWDVSNVQKMDFMFADSTFNQDISSWDLTNLKSMEAMFFGNKKFNQDLSKWSKYVSYKKAKEGYALKFIYKNKPVKESFNFDDVEIDNSADINNIQKDVNIARLCNVPIVNVLLEYFNMPKPKAWKLMKDPDHGFDILYNTDIYSAYVSKFRVTLIQKGFTEYKNHPYPEIMRGEMTPEQYHMKYGDSVNFINTNIQRYNETNNWENLPADIKEIFTEYPEYISIILSPDEGVYFIQLRTDAHNREKYQKMNLEIPYYSKEIVEFTYTGKVYYNLSLTKKASHDIITEKKRDDKKIAFLNKLIKINHCPNCDSLYFKAYIINDLPFGKAFYYSHTQGEHLWSEGTVAPFRRTIRASLWNAPVKTTEDSLPAYVFTSKDGWLKQTIVFKYEMTPEDKVQTPYYIKNAEPFHTAYVHTELTDEGIDEMKKFIQSPKDWYNEHPAYK